MNKLKLTALGTCLASVSLLLAACSNGNNANNHQNLSWTETAQLTTQDLSLTTDSTSFQAEVNTQEGLYRLDKNQKPKLALAKSVKVSNGGRVYDFTLRKGLKWANGTPLTAKDFVYSWRRTVTPSTKSTMAFYLNYLKNAAAINASKKSPSSLGVSAPSKYHLHVELERPVSYFKRFLAYPLYFPQNQKFVEKAGKKYGTAAQYTLASGPFKMTKWTGNNKTFTLVKNKNYWDAKHVRLQKVNEQVSESSTTSYNLYSANKTDETPLTGEQVAANKGKAGFHARKAAALQRLELNQTTVPALKNKKIRQAFSLAINRQTLAKNVLRNGSAAAQGFVPSGMGKNPKTGEQFYKEAYVKAGVEYNLPKAKKLIREGMREAKVKSLNLTLLSSDDDNGKQIAEFLQSKLDSLPNVKISVQTIPYAQLISREGKKDYQLAVDTWKSILADPINFLDVFESDSSYNDCGWKNAEYDKLLDEAENVYGNQPEKRWTRLVKAEKILMNYQATIPLIQIANPQLVRTRVKNVSFNPNGVPYDFKNVYIANK